MGKELLGRVQQKSLRNGLRLYEMAKFRLISTGQFKKDLKLAKKRGLSLDDLFAITDLLEGGMPIPEKNRNHQLHG